MDLESFVAEYRTFRHVPVLLLGPPGVGKSRLAEVRIHTGPGAFVAVNCAHFPNPELLAAELFGTVAGAFTGAVNRTGKVVAARDGTLFLDEAHALTPLHQTQLNTFLDTRRARRMGADGEPCAVSTRVVLATWRPPEEWMLPDLRDRLGLHVFHVPPPSREDRAVAIEEHRRRFCDEHRVALVPLSPGARARLLDEVRPSYRGLFSRLERAIMTAVREQATEVLPGHVPDPPSIDVRGAAWSAYEAPLLAAANGSITKAAEIAGVSRSTWYRRRNARR